MWGVYAIYYRGSETPPTAVGRLIAPSYVAVKTPCGGIPPRGNLDRGCSRNSCSEFYNVWTFFFNGNEPVDLYRVRYLLTCWLVESDEWRVV